MTTGSYSMDAYVNHTGGFVGTKGSCSWSGPNTPRDIQPPATFYDIHREVYNPKTGKSFLKAYHVRMPGYRPKRKRFDTCNPYTKDWSRLTDEVATNWKGGVGPFTIMSFANPGSWATPPTWGANDQIKLVNKLSELTAGSDFNMSVFLGEGHQTLALLGDTAIRIAKAANHLRKRDVTGAARSLLEGTSRKPLAKHDWAKNRPGVPTAKNLSSLWLELQYGWLPLLNDAEACAKSLAHALNSPFAQTYRTKVRKEVNYDLGSVDVGSGNILSERKGTKVYERFIVARISEKPSVLAQLGLLDPELVAWELMPFSFVADWFIPIGSWMEARAAASRLTGSFILSDKTWCRFGPIKLNGKGYPSTFSQMHFGRASPTTSLKVPMPELKSLDKVASWQHCANAVALVIQAFK